MIAAFMAGYMGKTAYRPLIAQAFASDDKLHSLAEQDLQEDGPISQKMHRDHPGIQVQLDDIKKEQKKDRIAARIIAAGFPVALLISLAGNSEVRGWVKEKYNNILGRG
jgi:hypothetical protein